MLPSDLMDLWMTGLMPDNPIAVDTETSGLYPDDGARVATVSCAWADYNGDWLDFANRHKNLTWNIETIDEGHEVPIVSIAWPFDQGVQGKPEDIGQYELNLFEDSDNLDKREWNALMRWLAKSACPEDANMPPDWETLMEEDRGLVMHPFLFDVLMLDAGCRRWPGEGWFFLDHINWDTQIGNHMLWPLRQDPNTGKPTTSLKPTSRSIWGMDVADEQKIVAAYLRRKRLPAGRWDLMPWEIIGSYADKDARLTKMLELRQKREINARSAALWFEDAGATMEKMGRRIMTGKLLTMMEIRGLPYDEVGSRLAADECLARAEKVATALPFTPWTLDAAKDHYFGEPPTGMGLVPYAVTDKGAPSMTAEVVGKMIHDGVEGIDVWGEYSKVTNAASMWYTAYADAMGTDGRLRCRFRQNGTVSTRFSVERVNLQAIPQDYRLSDYKILEGIPTPRDLIARAIPEGFKLWELDLAQAELRVAAMFAGCDKMLDMIRADADLHTYTTRELFPDIDPKDPLFKSKWRQVGKRGNFSLGFGSGPDTFQAMVSKETGIVLGDAMSAQVVRDWNGLYPEFGRAIDKHMATVTKRQRKYGHGWVDLINKERRWWQQFEDTHKAFNQRVQGNLAQFGIDWMLASDDLIVRTFKHWGFPSWNQHAGLILTIHDSQNLLLPDTPEGENLALACAQIGRDLWAEWFPEVPGDVELKVWGGKD